VQLSESDALNLRNHVNLFNDSKQERILTAGLCIGTPGVVSVFQEMSFD
jgi:hypothetical protein